MKNLIEKYLERILIDYPEKDKIYIDLMQFAQEVRNESEVPKETAETPLEFSKLKIVVNESDEPVIFTVVKNISKEDIEKILVYWKKNRNPENHTIKLTAIID